MLMGVYLVLLPLPEAMLLHAVTQLAANGSRALYLRPHIHRASLVPYSIAALLVLAGFSVMQIVVSKPIAFLVLGGVPLAFAAARHLPPLDFTRRPHAAACGALVTGAQLVAGASGPLLDVFFLGGQLSRHEVVATKALTQSFGHILKGCYYGAILTVPEATGSLPWWIAPACATTACVGTAFGKRLLDAWNDRAFLTASRRFVLCVCTLLVARGLYGLA